MPNKNTDQDLMTKKNSIIKYANPSSVVKKMTLSKWWLAAIFIIIVMVLMILKFTQSTQTKASLHAWENVHEWRADGECADCHSKLEHVEQMVDFKHTLPIPAAKTHTEQFRRFTHGKGEKFSANSCKSCHEPDTCSTCHAILPETHTSDFIEPTGHSLGSLRHGMLAKTSPESCFACHRSFTEACTTCHTPGEVLPWQRDAAKSNSHWNQMLNFE